MNVNFTPPTTTRVICHILVVEDEFLVRMMLSDVLREAGHIVTEACNADEALLSLQSKMPDLIVTDVRMPGSCDGLEFTAKVRETNSMLPIIVTSAHHVPATNPFEGPTQFLSKPYDFETVIKLIDAELSQ